MDFTSLTPKEVRDPGIPCEAVSNFKHAQPPLDWSNPAKALGNLRDRIASHVILLDRGELRVGLKEETAEIPINASATLPIRIFRKAEIPPEEEPRPLMVLYFPGGFIMGDPMTMAPLARSLVRRFNVVVACPMYRLAPEHSFPKAFEDSYAALKWLAVAENSISYHADPTRGFIVGGMSSGGNIANTMAHLARDEGLQPPLTGVWLSCAGARVLEDYNHLLPNKYRQRLLSRAQEECVNNDLSSKGMDQFKRDAFRPDLNSRLYAPLIWSANETFGHEDLPRTFQQVAGMDPARDEALIFDDMLRFQGTPTLLHMYPGLPHCFYMFPNFPQSKDFEKNTLDGFEWLLTDAESGLVNFVDRETAVRRHVPVEEEDDSESSRTLAGK